MNQELLAWTLAAMNALAPGRDHTDLASATANRVDIEAPLFRDDADKKKTLAVLVVIQKRESDFTLNVVGDFGTSYCSAQVSNAVGGGPALLTDPDACIAAALRVLRWSVKSCPAFPLGPYASGLNGCVHPRAQRISRSRMAEAAHLVRTIVVTPKTSLFLSPPAAWIRATCMRGMVALLRRDEDPS